MANQIRDYRHKVTSRFVSACRVKRAETIVIGDLTGIRQRIDYGRKTNQKLHQWAFRQLMDLIEYKAKQVGIAVEYEDEAYTSQTCPRCRHRHKPRNRNYKCPACGWNGHRDVVGTSNIWTKHQGWLLNPVVGSVVESVGVRYHPHLCRLDSWSPRKGTHIQEDFQEKLTEAPSMKARGAITSENVKGQGLRPNVICTTKHTQLL